MFLFVNKKSLHASSSVLLYGIGYACLYIQHKNITYTSTDAVREIVDDTSLYFSTKTLDAERSDTTRKAFNESANVKTRSAVKYCKILCDYDVSFDWWIYHSRRSRSKKTPHTCSEDLVSRKNAIYREKKIKILPTRGHIEFKDTNLCNDKCWLSALLQVTDQVLRYRFLWEQSLYTVILTYSVYIVIRLNKFKLPYFW